MVADLLKMVKSQLKAIDRQPVAVSRAMTATECAQAVPQIAEWNGHLSSANERLMKAAEVLLSKIAPVMREEGKDECANGTPRPALVPLADVMRGHCDIIVRVADRLEYAASRVEL